MLGLVGSGSVLPARGVTPEDFVDRVQGKLQVTSSIYLEAVSRRLDTAPGSPPDTAHLTLAYRYPDRFLQRVRGRRGRRQVLIVRGDSFVLGYPHLDHVVRRSLSAARRRRLFIQHVPLAAAFLGVREDVLPREALSVREEGSRWVVTVRNPKRRYDFRSVTARFRARDLRPESFIIRGPRRFRIHVTKYVEEQRFPLWVERMFDTLNPTVRETPPDD